MPFDFIDHLVYATTDLEGSARVLGERLGVNLEPGGAHEGRGTANVLMSLGGSVYLEIIGPDPDQPDPAGPRAFGIDELKEPCLVTWAVTTHEIDAHRNRSIKAGYDPGVIFPMSRRTPDGELLEWRLILQEQEEMEQLIPFLIDWGKTTSPALRLPKACLLNRLELCYPDPDGVKSKLDALGISVEMTRGSRKITASIKTPIGEVKLS